MNMDVKIPVSAKKTFIKFLVNNYSFKIRESTWILNNILVDPKLLELVHFVEEAHYCPTGLVISTNGTTGVDIRLYSGALMTGKSENILKAIKGMESDFYIQIVFPDPMKHWEYLGVLETNPHSPRYLTVSSKTEKDAEEFVKHMEKINAEIFWQSRVDFALDTKNKRLFNKLVKQKKKEAEELECQQSEK